MAQEEKRLEAAEIEAARVIDPSLYLTGQGYAVRREGRHLSVRLGGEEHYRITRKEDGHWVACDKLARGVGDNIALVQRIEPGTGFREAVQKLTGFQRQAVPEMMQQRPILPPLAESVRQTGRQYLKGRGISLETIRRAEYAGFLRYAGGGVLFVGYDSDGQIRNVTRRAIDRADAVPKRDFRGSDKQYPPILAGSPSSVWIVEGGTDALALHEMARRGRQSLPTVIVSGGANVRSFLENPAVQQLLQGADRVTIARERERDAGSQAETDAAHDRQRERIEEITSRAVRDWRPPAGVKDLAELNIRQISRSR